MCFLGEGTGSSGDSFGGSFSNRILPVASHIRGFRGAAAPAGRSLAMGGAAKRCGRRKAFVETKAPRQILPVASHMRRFRGAAVPAGRCLRDEGNGETPCF